MFSLSSCRIALTRSSCWRHVALLLVLAMVLSGVPRWEIHAHADVDAGHGHVEHSSADHSHGPDGHAGDVSEPANDDSGLLVAHVHDLTSITATVLVAELARVGAIAPAIWSPPRFSTPAAASSWPPPQRPPIV